MLLLLFDPPPQLGYAGWLVLLVLFIASGVIHLIQLRKSKGVETAKNEVQQAQNETSHWRGTAGAFEKELTVVRERCDRMEGSLKTAVEENAVLRTRTDLDALSKSLANEGRRAQEAHEAILHGLENLAGSVAEMTRRIVEMTEQATNRDVQYATLINSQSELIKSLQSQMNLKAAMRKAS
jgi:trehalose-6-phosphate synthase